MSFTGSQSVSIPYVMSSTSWKTTARTQPMIANTLIASDSAVRELGTTTLVRDDELVMAYLVSPTAL
eukprot:2475248-Pleurochrysis_carterae.AAC.2